jgi:phosphatidate phosphatase APP1
VQPNTTVDKLNQLANVFVPGDFNSLPASQQAQARNLTAGIFVVQQGAKAVSINMQPAPVTNNSGPGLLTSPQTVTLPYSTSDQGDFDVFVQVNTPGLVSGNLTQQIQRVNTYANGATLGNATAYLVPTEGYTIISDIDDILRITKIYQPKEGLLNSFARPFVPWMNMPDIYANWSRSIPNMHFHYRKIIQSLS